MVTQGTRVDVDVVTCRFLAGCPFRVLPRCYGISEDPLSVAVGARINAHRHRVRMHGWLPGSRVDDKEVASGSSGRAGTLLVLNQQQRSSGFGNAFMPNFRLFGQRGRLTGNHSVFDSLQTAKRVARQRMMPVTLCYDQHRMRLAELPADLVADHDDVEGIGQPEGGDLGPLNVRRSCSSRLRGGDQRSDHASSLWQATSTVNGGA